ncbi:alpha/beta-hydrolase [Delitschia confertaspora ATCC 74209]|uniref:Alpha/beta-hydrolase n=1 Tax=Delitschia confertaspora ATCC 74209 TaxID=1513339 RepID=A0A9P4JIG8_9PLEO|nr:alpha/beta-hydrolase [Delitschia confertaspora ATCC 74209]
MRRAGNGKANIPHPWWFQTNNISESVEITAWGATCTDRNLTVHLEKTSKENFTTDSYGHEVFFALTRKEILISGSYQISTRLCVPEGGAKSDSIQMLAHGATYTKHMWDFAYQPSNYSWVKHMNEAGYATFAFDLLGAGNSSRPNAMHETQTQAHVETASQFVDLLKTGALDGKKWSRVIYVGFSIGASVGNSLATQYPEKADQLILLGLSWFHDYIYPALLMMLRSEANKINATRWGTMPDLYTTMPSLITRQFSHLYGDFDEGVEVPDYEDLDADTVGEAVSFTFHAREAPDYTGSVFLGIGNNDVTFCGPTCEDHHLEVYNKFPKAVDHLPLLYPNTGHNILLHRTGPKLLQDVTGFIKKHDK